MKAGFCLLAMTIFAWAVGVQGWWEGTSETAHELSAIIAVLLVIALGASAGSGTRPGQPG